MYEVTVSIPLKNNYTDGNVGLSRCRLKCKQDSEALCMQHVAIPTSPPKGQLFNNYNIQNSDCRFHCKEYAYENFGLFCCSLKYMQSSETRFKLHAAIPISTFTGQLLNNYDLHTDTWFYYVKYCYLWVNEFFLMPAFLISFFLISVKIIITSLIEGKCPKESRMSTACSTNLSSIISCGFEIVL